jgi:hypothetical protein
MEPYREDTVPLALTDQQLELQCKLLEFELRLQQWRCEEYRKLLEEYFRKSSVDREASAADLNTSPVRPGLPHPQALHRSPSPASQHGKMTMVAMPSGSYRN